MLLMLMQLCCFGSAGPLACPATLTNAGNVRINDAAVTGNHNNCSQTVMAPGDTIDCLVWRNVSRDELARTVYELVATNATGTPNCTASSSCTLNGPGDSAIVSNATQPYIALLSVDVKANTTHVQKAGDVVLYTIELVRQTLHGKVYSVLTAFLLPSLAECC